MNACENHGNETVVVYNEKRCPLCVAENKIDELGDDLATANDSVDTLNNQINDMQDTIDMLESKGE